MIKIDQWMGAKGITIEIDTYGFSVFPSILSRYRNRHYFKPNYLHEIFSIRKNLRDVICDWSLDITILGLTFQFNKYKEWMKQNLTNPTERRHYESRRIFKGIRRVC